MKLELVAIFDQALGAFARPAFVPSVGVALRGFEDECNRPDGEIFRHPADYSLFLLGSFDDSTGRFELLPQPERRALATEVLHVQK